MSRRPRLLPNLRKPWPAAAFCVALAAASAALGDDILGLSGDGSIVRFDAARPGTIVSTTPVSGLAQNEFLVGVAFRPTDGALFGVGSTDRLYQISTDTGFASAVGGARFTPALEGEDFGVAFDPTGATILVTSDAGQSVVLDASDGVASAAGTLVYAAGDVHAGAAAGVAACAWRSAPKTGEILYGIDLARGLLVRIDDGTGTAQTVGPLGLGALTAAFSGFCVSSDTGAAYAAFDVQGDSVSRFYGVDLATGAATEIGASTDFLRDVAVVPSSPAAPAGTRLVALVGGLDLVTVTTDAPQSAQRTVHLSGLPFGDALLSVATRPATGVLYGLTKNALYDLDDVGGTAERVGDGFAQALPDGPLACDFDPTTGRIRVVGGADSNLVVDADQGEIVDRDVVTPGVQTDAPFAFAPGDPFGSGPAAVGAIAFVGRTTPGVASKAYVLEEADALLARCGSPARSPDEARDGTLYGVGPLSIDGVASLPPGLAMTATSDRTAYAAIETSPGSSSLYHVNLATGAASIVQSIGAAGVVHGLTSEPTTVPPRLKITKMSVKLNFKKTGRDSLTLTGSAPFAVGTSAGQTVTIDVDGLSKTFTMNAKSKAKIGGESIRVGGQVAGGVGLAVALKKEDLVGALADEGMDGAVFERRLPRQIGFAITMDGKTFRTIVDVYYSAKPGKTGVATK